MVLGRVLERLGDEAFAAETLMALEDLNLMVQVEAAGRPFGENMGEYAAGASRRFAQSASDDDWLALMTALERADDAGTACLKHMLEWSLRHDAEGPGEGCGGHCTCQGN
ncbi:MAG: hypothetical protein HYZ40_01370 [Rhodospirillales bacterium]|nr:hypothetical protein [Rhodospirillales bacterium]